MTIKVHLPHYLKKSSDLAVSTLKLPETTAFISLFTSCFLCFFRPSQNSNFEMAVAMALTVAQTLFAALQCAEVRKLCSSFKYNSELEKLQETVTFIKNGLRDIDSKWQELTKGGQDWIEKLKDAVYDADDLFDEFNTVAQQLKAMPGGKLSKKVRRFFSSKNQVSFAISTSVEIKKLREKLDDIAKNRRDFGFSELYKPVKYREETSSYVQEKSIIGREVEIKAILDKLLQDTDSSSNVPFLQL